MRRRVRATDSRRVFERALARLLVDPRFLYRMEEEPASLRAGDVYRIGDIELASRLSFFIWSSIPDDELMGLATTGALSKPGVLDRQLRRMLADPRAGALTDNFAGQWLRLRELRNVQPLDAAFDENLREAFAQETQMFFSDIVREDLGVTRPVGFGLHVFKRTSRAPLRHGEYSWRLHAPRRAGGQLAAPGFAGAGEHPHGDFRGKSHITGHAGLLGVGVLFWARLRRVRHRASTPI